VKKRSGCYPRLTVDRRGSSVVPNAGAVLLLRTAEAVGLDTALSAALTPWRRPLARHDPGKIALDLAVSLAIGGDCLAIIAQLRSAPQVFGPVDSDPTVSRLVDTVAVDASAALAAIAAARAAARERAWSLAGGHAPDHDIDVDATLVTAHSEKERAAPTFKRGFGFHPVRREALTIRVEMRPPPPFLSQQGGGARGSPPRVAPGTGSKRPRQSREVTELWLSRSVRGSHWRLPGRGCPGAGGGRRSR
jgi:hypothetical protein